MVRNKVLLDKMLPCHSREAVVTVKSYHNGTMDGWLQHPRLEKTEEIQSLSQMVLLLNTLLDLEGCPGHPLPLVHSAPCGSGENISVFRIQVLFREHGTWQGKLVWQNENKETVFHSVMELMELLDEILAE